jgi:hypothetical protein
MFAKPISMNRREICALSVNPFTQGSLRPISFRQVPFMSTMFALVITVGMLIGGNQDVLLGVYDSEKDCRKLQLSKVKGECYPLKGVLAEHPAGFTAQM